MVKFERLTVFILRVPYSVIEALHDREFRLIDQPARLSDVNDALDAYGFDFVQPPAVETKFWRSRGNVYGRIDSFMRGGLDPDDFGGLPDAGRSDLAMVMLDPKYNGSWFNLHHHYDGKVLVSHHWFGQDLAEADWTFSLPAKVFGGEFMVIYVDTHGNERAEAIEISGLPGRRPPASAPKAKPNSRAVRTAGSAKGRARTSASPKKASAAGNGKSRQSARRRQSSTRP